MNLIYGYLYREITLLAFAVIGILTFLLSALDLFKVVQLMLNTELPLWMTLKFIFIEIPFVLTMTIPAGLLAAVIIVFGRMSSDRELLAIKAAGVGLAQVVAPVIIIATFFSLLDFWLITQVVPECRRQNSEMRHDIVTSHPMDLFTPETVIDKIPGWKICVAKKKDYLLEDVQMWQLDDQKRVVAAYRAETAKVSLDLEHTDLVIMLYNARQEQYPANGDLTQVQQGGRGGQIPIGVSLSSFYERVEKRLSWMTLPEIQKVIYDMQTAPSDEPAIPYLTEFQARISLSVACFTFVIVGIPLAIQTQRKETSAGVVLTIVIVGIYMLLNEVGRALKNKAGLYPELIIWAPNFIFQILGFYLFYRANRK